LLLSVGKRHHHRNFQPHLARVVDQLV
jgi:hypothetical protein